MEHFLSYSNFSEGYDNFNIDDLNEDNFDTVIDNIALYEGKFGLFKKIKIWAKSPKVKKLQNKANKERLKGIKEEVKIKKDTAAALSDNKDIDIERVKDTLMTKREATEKIATTYENEAGAIASGNEYLMKVIRVASAKGIIEQNKLRIEIADEDEKNALESLNNDVAKIIREDLFDIKQKMKDPTYQSADSKDVKGDETDYSEIDPEELAKADGMDFKQKLAILKKKWKTLPTDNHTTVNIKRAQLRKEIQILREKPVRGTKYDKDLDAFDKSSGVDLSTKDDDEIQKWADEEIKKKKKNDDKDDKKGDKK